MSKLKLIGIIVILLLSPSAYAMDFRVSGYWIIATGEVEPGDAHRLRSLVERQPVDRDGFRNVVGVSLSSPGGDLGEGIELGRTIRDLTLQTLVEAGNTCASACALAFLGGVRQHATGASVYRGLERHGRLGFHGFRFSDNDWQIPANLGIEITQIINGIILDYAADMGNIDLAFLANTLRVSSGEMYWVNSPLSIESLGITLFGSNMEIDETWSTTVCRTAVAEQLPFLHRMQAEQRVFPPQTKFFDEDAFLEIVLSLTYSDPKWEPAKNALTGLAADDALSMLGIHTFSPRGLRGAVLPLERGGSGFHFNHCVAVITDGGIAYSLLIDPRSAMRVWTRLGKFGHLSRTQSLW